MKPGKSVDVKEDIAEVHSTARSPSPKLKNKTRQRSKSGSRKLSNGHIEEDQTFEPQVAEEPTPEKTKARDSWIKSEHESIELPIHDQIKQGILGFIEQEIKKPENEKNPALIFYSHDPTSLDDKFRKNLSRPSSGHKEKRSPSFRRKKRHSSKHGDRELQDFEVPGSSLSALERVDDYLKEYNKEEVVTLSGELEIEANDVENNNSALKGLRHKPRKTRRKIKDERQQDSNANGREISPKVFKSTNKSKKLATRPTDLTDMLESLESSVSYHNQYIDNPFSSPSPLTSPNDERLNPFATQRPEKVYLQGGGTFRAVSRDRILESQQSRHEEKFLRLGHMTPLDMALSVQKAWRRCAGACHGILGGVSLMHLILISYSDGHDPGHLSFHSVVTMPYVAVYYFFCILCLLSVLDRLDVPSMDCTAGMAPYFRPLVLTVLYSACLLVCGAARLYDQRILHAHQLHGTTDGNHTAFIGNDTMPTIPAFYHTWTHFSIWRAVLSILGLIYFVISNPRDLVYYNISKLLQFKQSLQSIG